MALRLCNALNKTSIFRQSLVAPKPFAALVAGPFDARHQSYSNYHDDGYNGQQSTPNSNAKLYSLAAVGLISATIFCWEK